MVQTIGLHHTDYTKRNPNVKSGQTEICRAKLIWIQPDGNLSGWIQKRFRKKLASGKDSEKAMVTNDIMESESLIDGVTYPKQEKD